MHGRGCTTKEWLFYSIMSFVAIGPVMYGGVDGITVFTSETLAGIDL